MEDNNTSTAVQLAQEAAREFQKSREFEVGDIVKHFQRELVTQKEKGHNTQYLYEIVSACAHSCDEFGSEYVVYRALYPPYDTFVRHKSDFISRVDKEEYPDVKQEYRFEKLLSESSGEIDCSDIYALMARPEVIIQARYLMDEQPYEYSTLRCWFRDGSTRDFHYHRNNRMPRRYCIEGKTWPQLCGLIEGISRGMIQGDTVLFKEGRMNER